MSREGRNARPAYVLGATGRNEFGGRWSCVHGTAFLDEDAARAALSAFAEACRKSTGSLSDPVPSTVEVSVTTLDLHDDLPEGEPEELFLVDAKGRSAVHEGAFQCLSRRAFSVREAAEAWAGGEFRERCTDPDGGLDYARHEGLSTNVVRLRMALTA